MKCYRIWFVDGTARLVDASNESEAVDMAEHLAKKAGNRSTAIKAECLDSEPEEN